MSGRSNGFTVVISHHISRDAQCRWLRPSVSTSTSAGSVRVRLGGRGPAAETAVSRRRCPRDGGGHEDQVRRHVIGDKDVEGPTVELPGRLVGLDGVSVVSRRRVDERVAREDGEKSGRGACAACRTGLARAVWFGVGGRARRCTLLTSLGRVLPEIAQAPAERTRIITL